MKEILHFISNMDRGGQETYIMNVFKTIDRSCYNFSFLCTNRCPGDYDNEIEYLGGTIYYTPSVKPTSVKILKYLYLIESYRKALRNTSFNLLHIHNYHALSVFVQLMAAKLAGVKAIIVHSHNTSGEHEKIHKIFRIIIRIFKFKRLACSKEAAIWMFRSLDNVTIIKNGIIADNFTYNIVDRNKVRNILGIDGKTVLIHIGRFHRQKNHIFLLDIFQNYLKNNPNSVLILVGRGELESEVVNKINTSKISDKVLLLGVKSNISELLSASDIFIFPSLYEGLGIALIEAQASGLYCIVSDTIPHEAIISDKLVRCPLGDMSVWVEAIIKIQSLEYDRNEYIQNVINNGFDIIINNNTLIKIYDEV